MKNGYKKLCYLFAEMIDYPFPHIDETVEECLSLFVPSYMTAIEPMKKFQTCLKEIPRDRLEEIYTSTFNPQAVCIPYVGHHLFCEDSRRVLFIAGLEEHYRIHAFSAGNELPDHLGVMLRFLPEEDEEVQEELIGLCILPALKKMMAGFGESDNPYRYVLEALLSVLSSPTVSGFVE